MTDHRQARFSLRLGVAMTRALLFPCNCGQAGRMVFNRGKQSICSPGLG
jgi:hypothetical protein